MLKWCAYCQQFTGESPEYDDFSITHGLCASCGAGNFDLFGTSTVEHAVVLRAIFEELFSAGRRNDFAAAAVIVDKAIAAHCRPVDILVGMLAPMLFQIGEDWKHGIITVEGENRFTAFSEQVIDLVESKIHVDHAAPVARSDQPLLFLMNAPGNRHTLAIRILALWLESKGFGTRIIDERVGMQALMRDVTICRPGYLLMSMALLDQRDHVADVAAHIQALPQHLRPKMLVGGYPVKVGLVLPIPGADLVPDISALSFA